MAKLGLSVKCLESESDALIIERFSPLDRPQISENNIHASNIFFDLDQPTFPRWLLKLGSMKAKDGAWEKIKTNFWPYDKGLSIQAIRRRACGTGACRHGRQVDLKSARCGDFHPVVFPP